MAAQSRTRQFVSPVHTYAAASSPNRILSPGQSPPSATSPLLSHLNRGWNVNRQLVQPGERERKREGIPKAHPRAALGWIATEVHVYTVANPDIVGREAGRARRAAPRGLSPPAKTAVQIRWFRIAAVYRDDLIGIEMGCLQGRYDAVAHDRRSAGKPRHVRAVSAAVSA